MKPTQITELFANIKASFVSFFSILMFVALGVGSFVGISWSAPALEEAIYGTFEQGTMHHIQIQFPYGLTNEDIDKLKAVEGVDAIEGGYTSFQTYLKGATHYTFKFQSIFENIDLVKVVEGELPKENNEIVIDQTSAKDLGISIGDTITFVHDQDDVSLAAENTASKSGMQYLNSDSFKVVGFVISPEYVSLTKETYGFSTSSSGTIDAVAWARPQAFNASAFHDAYPMVNIRSNSLQAAGNSFRDGYGQQSSDLKSRIVTLGNELSKARYNKLHDEGQRKIDDAEAKLNDARTQIADAEKKLADGEQALADGKKKVAEGEELLAYYQSQYDEKAPWAYSMIEEGEAQIAEGERQYAQGEAMLAEAKKARDELHAKYVEGTAAIDAAEASYQAAQAKLDELAPQLLAGTITLEQFWAEMAPLYSDMVAKYNDVGTRIAETNAMIDKFSAAYPDVKVEGRITELSPLPSLEELQGNTDPAAAAAALTEAVASAKLSLDTSCTSVVMVDGIPVTLNTVEQIEKIAPEAIAEAEQKLADARAQLDEGYARIDSAKAELASAEQQLADGKAALAAAKEKVAQGERELESGKEKLASGKSELAEKERQFQTAKNQFSKMKEYGWAVAERKQNGGALQTKTYADIMGRLSISMAGLFIIVGLLVTYSAVSRIVHEQIVQIGTKKALGLRRREITMSFLLYSGIAVFVGAILGVSIGVIMVEGITNGYLGQRFITGPYPPYIGIDLALAMTMAELVLVLLATWFACRNILKQQAIDLLRGEKPPVGKTRFFEKWKAWQRLPLYTQTIVNNCLNDKRRVFSTVVGVAGCTALIVTAIMLNNNVLNSYDRHYQYVYSFNAIAYVDGDVDGAANAVAAKLEEKGGRALPLTVQRLSIKFEDDTSAYARLLVPSDAEAFSKFVHLRPLGGGAEGRVSDDGVWVSQAYAEHHDAHVGDKVKLETGDGALHELTIVGINEFNLTYHEIVASPALYEKEFGTYSPNAVIADTGSQDLDALANELTSIKGFESLRNDKLKQSENFSSFASVSLIMVLIYLMLSSVMAVVVLLNLNFMFIEEKKRDLIVLMINGFSVKQAKGYIRGDTIVLTVIGILAGLLIGWLSGMLSVIAIEPDVASFLKGVDPMSLIVGTVGSAVLSTIMSFISLRRIPKFKLTDINKL